MKCRPPTSEPRRLGTLSTPLGEEQRNCERHGPYLSRGMRLAFGPGRDLWTTCAACLAEEQEAEAEKERVAAADRARVRLEASLSRSGLPARFVGLGFDGYRAETPGQQRAVRVTRQFAERFDSVYQRGAALVMVGNPGTGKTHLAGAVLQAVMPRYAGLYLTMSAVVDMVRDTWRRDSERSKTQVMSDLARVDLLVIDEIGAGHGTESERAILFDIIDRRYMDRKPMILISNLDRHQFGATVGDRSHDRLIEIGTWVVCDWSSHRAQARKEGKQ